MPVVPARCDARLRARSKYAKEAEAIIGTTQEKESNGHMYGVREVSLGEVSTGKVEYLSGGPSDVQTC